MENEDIIKIQVRKNFLSLTFPFAASSPFIPRDDTDDIYHGWKSENMIVGKFFVLGKKFLKMSVRT